MLLTFPKDATGTGSPPFYQTQCEQAQTRTAADQREKSRGSPTRRVRHATAGVWGCGAGNAVVTPTPVGRTEADTGGALVLWASLRLRTYPT